MTKFVNHSTHYQAIDLPTSLLGKLPGVIALYFSLKARSVISPYQGWQFNDIVHKTRLDDKVLRLHLFNLFIMGYLRLSDKAVNLDMDCLAVIQRVDTMNIALLEQEMPLDELKLYCPWFVDFAISILRQVSDMTIWLKSDKPSSGLFELRLQALDDLQDKVVRLLRSMDVDHSAAVDLTLEN